MAPPRTAFVVCGGGPAHEDPRSLGEPDVVIAADGGLGEAVRLELDVDVVVGDMDSVSPEALARVEDGAAVVRHPSDKDVTDLELGIGEAVARGADHIVVVGGAGGRLDFVLMNALVLTHERLAAVQVDAVFGAARVHVVRDERALAGAPGEPISLLAVGGPARGVRTRGLRWAMDGRDLQVATGLGASNEFVRARASIALEGGVLLAVRPGEEPHADV